MHLDVSKEDGRCLLKQLDVKPDDLALVITACCVLHNICEKHGEEFDSDWLDDISDYLASFPQPETGNTPMHSPDNIDASIVGMFWLNTSIINNRIILLC